LIAEDRNLSLSTNEIPPLQNRWLVPVLIVQLVLGFFFPPLPFGERLLFLSDLWLFAWVSYFGIRTLLDSAPEERRRLATIVLFLGTLFAIIFIHGKVRPSFAPLLAPYLVVPSDDLFSFAKEAVVAARFLFWIFAGLIVSRYALPLRPLERTLAICAIISALSMIAARLSPDIRILLGEIYRYDPHEANWYNRIYGTYRSPMEASATLAFSALLLVQSRSIRPLHRACGAVLLLAGIYLSWTLTAFLALPLVLFFAGSARLSPKTRATAWSLAIAAIVVGAAWIWNASFFMQKKANLLFRFKPWTVYWNAALERFDAFLFGYGFHPHFSDNIYVFLFSRGGTAALFAAIFGFVYWWKKNARQLSPFQQAIPLFFVISGLAVDSLILRPVVLVLVCVGVPMLVKRHPLPEPRK
jgi:hypothetical protein